MNKKYFGFDVDGTILNKKEEISSSTIEALKKAKELGHSVGLISGRPIYDMDFFNDQYENIFDFFICNNGTYFKDVKNDKLVFQKSVPKEIANKMIELGKEHNTFFAIHTNKKTYRTKLFLNNPEWAKEEIKNEWHKFELTSIDEIKEALENDIITQVSLRATKDIINLLYGYVEKYQDQVNLYIAGGLYLDANPLNTSKLTGIQDYAKYVGAKIEDFIVFGDSNNDLQMLRGAGYGIAMGNATNEAKEAADHVTGDHNTDAISKEIKRILGV